MIKIEVFDIRDVGKILDYVHDRVFQLEDISFDKENAILTIPITVISDSIMDQKSYLFCSTWKNPIVKSQLAIKNVTNFAVKDEAQIGGAGINTITTEDGAVVIKCSAPIELRAAVLSVGLELTLSENIVGKVSQFSLGSPPRK